jgi:hypothetical protein
MRGKILILGVLILATIIFSPSEEKYRSTKDIPNNYYKYSKMNWGELGYPGLTKLAQNGFVSPYQEDKFDCSEMAAYMEWYLEKYGFNTSICVSDHFDGSGGHAWVKVDTTDGKVAYIEPTAKRNIIVTDPKYESLDMIYESIYEVENINEFDWWKEINQTD